MAGGCRFAAGQHQQSILVGRGDFIAIHKQHTRVNAFRVIAAVSKSFDGCSVIVIES